MKEMPTYNEVEKIFNLISDEQLATLGEAHNIDWNVSRLYGKYMFRLLVFGLLRGNKLSTHTLEKIYNSFTYSFLSKKGAHQTRHSSLAARLNQMDSAYFESIFKTLVSAYSSRSLRRDSRYSTLIRYDSTMRQISSALIEQGMKVGRIPKEGYRKLQIKCTLGLRGLEGIPDSVEHFDDQSHLSEEIALKEAILANSKKDSDIVVFDMGLTSRAAFQTFDQEGLLFVTRGPENIRYDLIERIEIQPSEEEEKLHIIQDLKVRLYNADHQATKRPFRLIEAYDPASGKTFFFITNIWDKSPHLVAQFYHMRWDIEVFFRFIKQELGFSHLISRSQNGIMNQIYATMITAMMLLIFKQQNKIKGYREAILLFENGIVKWLVKELLTKITPDEELFPLQKPSQLFQKLLT